MSDRIEVLDNYAEATQIPGKDRLEKLGKELCEIQEYFRDIRRPTDYFWNDIDTFITPRRIEERFNYNGKGPRETMGMNIFDGSGASDLSDLADGLQAMTANSVMQWFDATVMSPRARSFPRIRKWVEGIVETVTWEYAKSNYYEELNETYNDAVTYGPSHVYGPEWDYVNGKAVWIALSPREVYFARNRLKQVEIHHREFPMTGRDILSQFPEAQRLLEKATIDKLKSRPFEEQMMLHCIYPREERDPGSPLAINRPWASVYVYVPEKKVLRESGFSRPMIRTWGWRSITGEVYPRSPAIDSIWDFLTLNSAAKSVLHSAQLVEEPPLKASESLHGKLRIQPRGVTYMESNQDYLGTAFDMPSVYPISMDHIQRLRTDLRKKVKADTFTLISNIQREITATQTMQIAGEQASVILPISSRSQNERLLPDLNAMVDLLYRMGKLEPPPPEIVELGDARIKIEFLGPVASAQKRYLQTHGLQAGLSFLLPMLQYWPSMAVKMDEDALYDEIMRATGAPSAIDRDMKEVAKIREAEAQARKQAIDLNKMTQLADAYRRAVKSPEPGSPAAAIGGALGGPGQPPPQPPQGPQQGPPQTPVPGQGQ